ncbi:dienelactone hydrolase family protein [Croceicoccus ponticola]|uniref:Dienelactone hydrolase family protein n=1 Tax=Croceicoccus ponticola TaxID=2217664 RepID=A0A437GX38_9SPHN|nr:dienelactone hydrolase family protein [Croceicoccus ponticola]RVQ66962.1 dienelactone hydrolase family protein [Croceicoccus ponticola]
MCDQDQLDAFRRNDCSKPNGKASRRSFNAAVAAAGGGAMLAACNASGGAEAEASTAVATQGGVLGGEVAIPTAGGTIGGWFYHPSAGNHPAVIMWPDIAGVRPAAKAMGERLAGEGFAVIVPDPYWRDAGHATFTDFADFMANDGFAKVTPYRNRFSAETIMADAKAIVAWLDQQDVVDKSLGMGARGHCMTGSWTIFAANASQRVTVAASMHGGGLVTEAADSPHKMLKGRAHYLFAIAQNDDVKEPEAKTKLREALSASGALGSVEVYPADHGWTVPDGPAYDKVQAERAYDAFLAMVQGLKIVAV